MQPVAATVMTEIGRRDLGAELRDRYDHQGRADLLDGARLGRRHHRPAQTAACSPKRLAACANARLDELGYGLFSHLGSRKRRASGGRQSPIGVLGSMPS